jgi:outer membrane protein OmpA-like peptidoglycan-associated protein
MKKNLTILLLTFFFLTTQGQHMEWASKITVEFNNGLSKERHSTARTNNYAHTLGAESLSESAHRQDHPSLKRVTSFFRNPHIISEVLIFDDNFDGQILKLVLQDEKGNTFRFFEKDLALVRSRNHGMVVLKIPTLPNTRVNKLTMDIYSKQNPRITPMDAVAISTAPIDLQHGEDLLPVHCIKEFIPINELNRYAPTFYGMAERLSDVINSQYLESKPLISPHGNRLFFVRKNAPTNYRGKKDDQDIYYSDLIDGQWTEARNIGHPLNDQFANGVCAISPDGNTMMVLNAYKAGKSKKVYDGVSISRKTYEGWSKPVEQIISGFQNFCDYQDYYINNSGDVMLLAIQMEETYGDQDVYVSYKTGENRWSTPINLGPGINTEGAEFSPFLSPDNKVLYFASDGHGGYGNSDVFYSIRLNNGWKEWSEPVNLGPEVNSQHWDGYFSIPPRMNYAYYVSSGSAVKRSLYDPNDADIYRIKTHEDTDRMPVVIVRGCIINKKTNRPIGGEVAFRSFADAFKEGSVIVDPKDGYTFSFDAGKKYILNATATGFISETVQQDFTQIDTDTEIYRNIYISPMDMGSAFQIENLFFVQSKAELLPESIPELEKLYLLLVKKPTLRIELGGHTDNQGSRNANLSLSEERANAVKTFLVTRGISNERLIAVGYGSAKPIASNLSVESRSQNRRVEVKVLRY